MEEMNETLKWVIFIYIIGAYFSSVILLNWISVCLNNEWVPFIKNLKGTERNGTPEN